MAFSFVEVLEAFVEAEWMWRSILATDPFYERLLRRREGDRVRRHESYVFSRRAAGFQYKSLAERAAVREQNELLRSRRHFALAAERAALQQQRAINHVETPREHLATLIDKRRERRRQLRLLRRPTP